MALLSIPLWVTPPNWASPVVESLEWLTAVYTSATGVEQRQKMRLAPRRTLEFLTTSGGQQRGFLEHQIDRYGGGDFYLPLWYESGRLAVSAAAGSTVLQIAGERTELSRASAVVVQGDKPYNWVLVEVSSGLASGGVTRLTLSAPGLSSAVRQGAKAYPAVPARLSEDSLSLSRQSSVVVNAQIRFDLLTPTDWADDPGLSTYDSYPVVDIRPNEGTPPTGSSKRLFVTADNDTGLRLRTDMAGIAFPGLSGSYSLFGRSRADYIRSLLYSTSGRFGPAWFLSPAADFRLAAPVAAEDTQIVVVRDGYTDTGGPTDERDRIAIRLRDGSTLYRQIVGAALIGDGDTELLTLDSAFTAGFQVPEVLSANLLSFGRFDQDRFELNHLTDADGVVEVAAVYRRVPDLRSASDWTPLPFPDDEEV